MGTIFTRWMAIVLAGLLLQGCGFHMRGNGIPSELMTMKVVGDNKSDFYRMVTTRLKASGVTLADKEGIPVLTLGGVGSTSQVASVNALGTDTEYVLGFGTQFHHLGTGQADPGLPHQLQPQLPQQAGCSARLLP